MSHCLCGLSIHAPIIWRLYLSRQAPVADARQARWRAMATVLRARTHSAADSLHHADSPIPIVTLQARTRRDYMLYRRDWNATGYELWKCPNLGAHSESCPLIALQKAGVSMPVRERL
jgi:hypothetical protein